jgi:hypothetical protein
MAGDPQNILASKELARSSSAAFNPPPTTITSPSLPAPTPIRPRLNVDNDETTDEVSYSEYEEDRRSKKKKNKGPETSTEQTQYFDPYDPYVPSTAANEPAAPYADIQQSMADLDIHPYAGIAKAVAARLGYDYYGTLFVWIDQQVIERNTSNIIQRARARIADILSNASKIVSPEEYGMLHAQAESLSALMQQSDGMTRGFDYYSRHGASGMGIPGGSVPHPKTLLTENVAYATSLVSQQIHEYLRWTDIWDSGDQQVMGAFAELVSLCITLAQMQQSRYKHVPARMASARRRINILLYQFQQLKKDSTGKYKFIVSEEQEYKMQLERFNPALAAAIEEAAWS